MPETDYCWEVQVSFSDRTRSETARAITHDPPMPNFRNIEFRWRFRNNPVTPNSDVRTLPPTRPHSGRSRSGSATAPEQVPVFSRGCVSTKLKESRLTRFQTSFWRNWPPDRVEILCPIQQDYLTKNDVVKLRLYDIYETSLWSDLGS